VTGRVTPIYYKVLTDRGRAFHDGIGRWDLPVDGKPGKWKNAKGDLVPCVNGLHVCTRPQLIHWLGPAIFTVEIDPTEIVDAGDKTVVRRARLTGRVDTWNERTARLFAADCAERALRLVKKELGWFDPRCNAAVKAARDFANGKIDSAACSAARSAAYSAARSAAAWAADSAAAWAADWAAYSAAGSAAAWAAGSAADWAAGSAAAWAADWAADSAAAWAADWAAGSAAAWAADWAADSAAAWAAGSAARSAADSAARSAAAWAAGSAARSAARQWQTQRLFEYLDGKRGLVG